GFDRVRLVAPVMVFAMGGTFLRERFEDVAGVHVVIRLLDQEEDHLITRGEPVRGWVGDAVGLVPDNRVPDNPPLLLQMEGDTPRNAHQALVANHLIGFLGSDSPGASSAIVVITVAIPEIEPERSFRGEESCYFCACLAELVNVFVDRWLEAILLVS